MLQDRTDLDDMQHASAPAGRTGTPQVNRPSCSWLRARILYLRLTEQPVAWRSRLALDLPRLQGTTACGRRYRGDSRGGAQGFSVGWDGRARRGAVRRGGPDGG